MFLPDATTVLVLTYRCCFNATESPYDQQTVLLRSTDGGKTFAPALLIGTHSQRAMPSSARRHGVDHRRHGDLRRQTVQRARLDGSAPAGSRRARPLGDDEYGGTLATLPDGGALAATYDFRRRDPTTFHVYRYSGVGDPNTDAAGRPCSRASPPARRRPAASTPSSRRERSGVYLFTQDNEVFGRFQLRKWTGSTFARARLPHPGGPGQHLPELLAGRRRPDSRRLLRRPPASITYRSSDRSRVLAPPLRSRRPMPTTCAAPRLLTAAASSRTTATATGGVARPDPGPAGHHRDGQGRGAVRQGGRSRLTSRWLLQKKTGKGWVTVKSTKVNAAGKLRVHVPAGKATWRAVAPAVEGYGEADGKPFAG